MNFLKRFFSNIPDNIVQVQNTNREACWRLRELGFTPVRIRRAVIDLNGVNIKAVARKRNLPASTLYGTLRKAVNRDAMEILAESVGLTREEFFPDEGKKRAGKAG